MSTIDNINLEEYSIEELQTLVERAQKEISNKEKARIQQIKSEIERLASTVGMSVADVVGLEGKKKKAVKSTTKKVAKYRHPENPEQTWGGRGKRPRWLQDALDQGAHLSDFAVGQ